MILKKLISVLLLCIFFSGSLFFYFSHKASQYYDSACERVNSIASDADKVKYLEDWAGSKINDKGFLELLGKKRKIFLDGGSSELRSKVDIDLRFLGLKEEAAYVSFNRLYKNRENFMDHTKFNSFEVGTGRFGVIINLNDPDELDLEWPPEDLRRLKRINDNALVICR